MARFVALSDQEVDELILNNKEVQHSGASHRAIRSSAAERGRDVNFV
jgi:hypothetical protein